MPDHIDEFESIFRRADKSAFQYVEIPINNVTLVTDGTPAESVAIRDAASAFLTGLKDVQQWRIIDGQQYSTVNDLLELVNQQQTDLVVTCRHLQERELVPQHSLGVHLDVLTQTTSIPVLVLPGTSRKPQAFRDGDCDHVMVVADHISGDNRLINYGVRLCRPGGTLWLCHVEDDRIYRRYMDAIQRIPEIDSDDAALLIESRLLDDAKQFIESCRTVIEQEGPHISVHSHVGRGHHLQDYRRVIDNEHIDLLVLNTKDDDQLAMNGRAYSMSVELIDVAMLLL